MKKPEVTFSVEQVTEQQKQETIKRLDAEGCRACGSKTATHQQLAGSGMSNWYVASCSDCPKASA